MDQEARVQQLEQENLKLRCENKELYEKLKWFEVQMENAAAHNRSIGDYTNAFKLLVAELKGGNK